MEIIKSEGDFVTSVEKAFDEIDIQWRSLDGVLAVGTHTPEAIEQKLEAIAEARQRGKPFLGICFGMQLAAIEYMRNKKDRKGANTEELSGDDEDVITKLPRLRVGMYTVNSWWATQGESHWHQYALNPKFFNDFAGDWDLAFAHEDPSIVEIMRYQSHPFFVGVQFHPEYQSSKEKPHPLLVEFLKACRK